MKVTVDNIIKIIDTAYNHLSKTGIEKRIQKERLELKLESI